MICGTHPSARMTHLLPFSSGPLKEALSSNVSLRALLMLNVKFLGLPLCQEGSRPHRMFCKTLPSVLLLLSPLVLRCLPESSTGLQQNDVFLL